MELTDIKNVILYHDRVGFISDARLVQYLKINNHINRLNKKYHMIISID